MKHTFFIFLICACLCLTACSATSNSSTLSTLNKQLDMTEKSLSSITSVEDNYFDLSTSTLNKLDEKQDSVIEDIERTKEIYMLEEEYKEEILDASKLIKNYIETNDISLQNDQSAALKALSGTLYKYSSNISKASNELDSTLRNYAMTKNKADRELNKFSTKLNKLICSSNTRCSYYENILNTLYQIEDLLKIPEDYTFVEEDNIKDSNSTPSKKWYEAKNIDTYLIKKDSQYLQNAKNSPKTIAKDTTPESNTNKSEKHKLSRNIDTYGPERRNIDSFYNIARENQFNGGYYNSPYRAYGYNRFNGYNGYGGFGGYGNFGPTSNDFNRICYPYNNMPYAPADTNNFAGYKEENSCIDRECNDKENDSSQIEESPEQDECNEESVNEENEEISTSVKPIKKYNGRKYDIVDENEKRVKAF